MERQEDQFARYDRKSLGNQRAYKRIKIAEILAAAGPIVAIPTSAACTIRYERIAA